MERFGPAGCPTFHGVASCVDYLCGYSGCWAGLVALYAREVKGIVSDKAATSLAVNATLVQLTMQGGGELSCARGPWAKGRTPFNRVYQIGTSDDWIYVQADKDLSADAKAAASRDEYIAKLKNDGFLAVPVYSCKKVAEVSKTTESSTLRYEKRESEGLFTETWKPTWFCFDGEPSMCPGAAAPSGAHAPTILIETLGHTEEAVTKMYADGIVLPIYWDKNFDMQKHGVWPGKNVSRHRHESDADINSFQSGSVEIGSTGFD